MDPSSLINPAAAAQFRDVVSRLMSADNVVRSEAETVYQQMKEQAPEQLVFSLLHMSLAEADQTIRIMSAIMLRQELVMHKEDWLWKELSPQTQAQVKMLVLHGIQAEANSEVRKKLADVVSELGIAVLNMEDNSWPELFPCLLGMSDSNDESARIVSMEIFSNIACRLPSSLSSHLKDMIVFLQKMFRDSSVKVRVASFGTVYGLLQICDDKSPEMKSLQSLIPFMLETIAATIHANDVETCEKSMEMLLDLAEFNVVFLRPNILNLIELMFSIAKSPQIDESLRHRGAEVLVTLSEAKPAMVRKIPNFLPEIFALLLDWNTHLEDNPDWNKGESEDLDDVDAAIAEESLDRLSICLGGETVSPILFSAIPAFLGSPDWRFRHAGLMSISVSGEGSMKYLSQHLQDVVGMILPFFQDPHPRVRWAACNTIGQMCSDFQPDIQNLFHEPIIVNIVQVMNDSENPRVQSHAASAIVNFCEDCGEEVLEPYLQPMLEKLHSLLQSPKIVQEQVVTAIAAIADCVKEKFTPFYDFFAPFLKDILRSALSAEFHVLRSKALECLSIIGVAVGKEKFGADHQEVINVLSRLHYNPNDPEASSMLLSWARLCKCLGQDFEPYLDMAMPGLMNSAKTEPPLEVIDAEDAESFDEEGWELIPFGEQTVCIKTTALEEKATACNILLCFADELKGKFFRYVEPVACILVPCLTFGFHDGVRSTAASTMPCLLRATIDYLETSGQQMNLEPILSLWNFIHPELLKGLRKEIEVDTHVSMLECLSECIDLIGIRSHDAKSLESTNEVIQKIAKKYLKLKRQRREMGQNEEDFDEFDEERLEEQNEKEDDIVALIAECIGKLFKFFKVNYLPYFAPHATMWIELLDPSNRPRDLQIALCVFDDVAEHIEGEAIPLVRDLFQYYHQYAEHENSDVRQASVFGIGVFAQVCGQAFGPVANALANVLVQVASHPAARESTNIYATENAISSVGKICVYQKDAVNYQKFVESFVSLLPVSEDKEESKITYSNLCTLIERDSLVVVGQNLERLSNVLHIFGSALFSDLVDDQLAGRISGILKLFVNANSGAFQQACLQIGEAEREKIMRTVSA